MLLKNEIMKLYTYIEMYLILILLYINFEYFIIYFITMNPTISNISNKMKSIQNNVVTFMITSIHLEC